MISKKYLVNGISGTSIMKLIKLLKSINLSQMLYYNGNLFIDTTISFYQKNQTPNYNGNFLVINEYTLFSLLIKYMLITHYILLMVCFISYTSQIYSSISISTCFHIIT